MIYLRVSCVHCDFNVVTFLCVSLAGCSLKKFIVRLKRKSDWDLSLSHLDKGHPTTRAGTHEGLLPGVQAPVVVQGVSLRELALAELAGVLLHPSVHVHVVLEARDPVEALPTLLAHERLDVGVLHRVQLQLAAVVEHGVTVLAGELLADLGVVDVQFVLLGQPLGGELLGTVAAHHCRAPLPVLAALVDLQEVLGLEDRVALVTLMGHLLLEVDLVLGGLHLVAPVDSLLVEVERADWEKPSALGAVGKVSLVPVE